MYSIKAGESVPDMEALGTVADLGATILEGELKVFGLLTHGSPTSPVSAGWFGCTQGRFDMVYPFTEQAIVVAGEVTLRNGLTGESMRYGPGDSWFVQKGTPVSWEIHTERFVKHYFAVA
ncbi:MULTISPECIES: cupin domain-containing protein [unclassified Paraburkholderia]|uniref:cupin domain-containing protein n=1 Tax=unclassified Paraburkholderia TaxID=2615204 RepID=UPI00197D14D9|nr:MULTISPECIES: cupin domain-containing protein [unclassified Paraburkholderia]MBN3857144.1 DUF861 domain-containing protein [Paraburkholderia sp. Ac-20340]